MQLCFIYINEVALRLTESVFLEREWFSKDREVPHPRISLKTVYVFVGVI